MDEGRQVLPEGLAGLAAGPELAAASASIDRSRLFEAPNATLILTAENLDPPPPDLHDHPWLGDEDKRRATRLA